MPRRSRRRRPCGTSSAERGSSAVQRTASGEGCRVKTTCVVVHGKALGWHVGAGHTHRPHGPHRPPPVPRVVRNVVALARRVSSRAPGPRASASPKSRQTTGRSCHPKCGCPRASTASEPRSSPARIYLPTERRCPRVACHPNVVAPRIRVSAQVWLPSRTACQPKRGCPRALRVIQSAPDLHLQTRVMSAKDLLSDSLVLGGAPPSAKASSEEILRAHCSWFRAVWVGRSG